MRTRLFGIAGALMFLVASAVVINAQHRELLHSSPHLTQHATQLTATLGLTPEQLASVEKVATDACAAMAKYHEQILAVLTPEQRAKLHEMHGAGGHDVMQAIRWHHSGR